MIVSAKEIHQSPLFSSVEYLYNHPSIRHVKFFEGDSRHGTFLCLDVFGENHSSPAGAVRRVVVWSLPIVGSKLVVAWYFRRVTSSPIAFLAL